MTKLADTTPGDLNLNNLVGLSVNSICQLVDRSGSLAEMQISLDNGPTVSFTVWTDWSLRVRVAKEGGIPDYLWPASDYLSEKVFPEGVVWPMNITGIEELFDEMGDLSGLNIELGERMIGLRSYGGELLAEVV
ncbi:hypothetical protein ACWED2_22150 [Amycolatopsis sp. NPDC005003]